MNLNENFGDKCFFVGIAYMIKEFIRKEHNKINELYVGHYNCKNNTTNKNIFKSHFEITH